jgi:hypothetical protein
MTTPSVPQTQVVNKMTPISAWHEGFNAYMDGALLAEMHNNAMRRGWWAALDAQAFAEMPKTIKPVDVVSELEDYVEYIADVEYWRKGAW